MTELPRETYYGPKYRLALQYRICSFWQGKLHYEINLSWLSWTGAISGYFGRLLEWPIIGMHSYITLNSRFPITCILRMAWCHFSDLYYRINSNCFVRAKDNHSVMLVTFVLYQWHFRSLWVWIGWYTALLTCLDSLDKTALFNKLSKQVIDFIYIWTQVSFQLYDH